MVDVSGKGATRRSARAQAFVQIRPEALARIRRLRLPKGNPLEIARIAGIAAAKRTADLIPLCHPLSLTYIDVEASLCENGIQISTRVTAASKTGVEMEALTAAAVAALTVYDMCKAADPAMTITDLFLVEKTGGRRGHYRRGLGFMKK